MINGKKLLAIMLVFTLTFSYFSIVTEVIATTDFISIFGNSSDTGNENVEFEAYLANEEKTSSAMISDVNNENLAIKLQLGVKNSGYLKDAKVEIKGENEKNLNFKISENSISEQNSNVQSLEDNVLTFNKIDNSSDKIEVLIPIEYENEEYINEEKLCSTSNVIISGIYVDDEGKENEISKEVELTLAWKDERDVSVQTEISKYIQFGEDGIILQTKVIVDNSNENKNSLPVKTSELNIEVPKINDVAPTEVRVVANSTLGTNGKGVGETQFNDENWNYNSDENKVEIKVENQKELVEVNKSESFLKIEGEEIQEERYYSQSGVDEYLITYTFRNVEQLEKINISTKAEAILTTFSGVEANENIFVTSAEKVDEYTLTGQTGNIISYNIENETKEKSKVYAYLNQETEYDSKTAINISYKDIVEEIIVEDVNNYYIDKSGNEVDVDDVYYKQICVSKEEFNDILGEEGNIQILDASGNLLTIINKETTADDNGNYIVNFKDKISKIAIKTSASINEGNLVIASKKAISSSNLSKADYAKVDYLVTKTAQKAKFAYVSDLVELDNQETKTKLNDTTTDFNLVIDRESLSTITTNSNVEIRLELNNDKETSDIYGNSIFEIEMPEYITGLNVTNASMIYGEGLEISGVESYVREDGKVIIKLTVEGNQKGLNSGVLTNGANIVLTADVTIDMYTPSKETSIKAYCYNSEATNYSNAVEYSIGDSIICEAEEVKIQYSAPNGLVAINTLANYNNVGATVTSIKQGEQVDYIDIYSEAKESTMEIIVVNNNDNSVSDLSILGRIPFKGVKDIANGEDLGTTLDTKLVSEIVSDEKNIGDFVVYYSENKEATKDLSDSKNEWNSNPSSFENIKSYLIVPKDDNYKMEEKQVLKFTYTYEIPADLDHNENIYGTFLAYYTNNTEVATVNETSKPDLVGLTTGVGPELDLEIKSDVKEVKVSEEITATISIKNIGEDIANNVVLTIPVPKITTLEDVETNKDNIELQNIDNNIVLNLDKMEKDETIDITLKLKVNDLEESDTDTISIVATATAKDLQKELKATSEDIEIKKSELSLTQRMDFEEPESFFMKGDKFTISLSAKNLTNKKVENVLVVVQLPKEVEFIEAYMVESLGEGNTEEIKNAEYDETTNKVTWKIDDIKANTNKTLKLKLEIGDLDAGMTEKLAEITAQISAENVDMYKGNTLNVNIGRSSLSITQTTSTPTYVKEGETIDYLFSIKNESPINATDVLLTDIIPDGIVVRSISYESEGIQNESKMSEKKNAKLTLTIPANSQVDVNVKALATSLDGVQEKTITNEGSISMEGIETISSNSVTHIIQANEDITDLDEISTTDETSSTVIDTDSITSTDITKTYKITGTAWLDLNENGMREDNEKRMENVTAMLVDSSTGVIKATTTTNNNGEYTFAGLQNGSYLVLFKYDTVLYTTTTYKKEEIESNINSDAVTTKIEQDGKKENGAVTDVININGASVSNIDIGFVEAEQFSLQLDKTISKVTVQNSQGTKTEEFDKTKLAKYDIAAKYLSGTTVYVEYTFTVTNNGDLSGYATEIVDYVPKGMTFNSNLNPDWYTGTDGNLYTKSLANVELTKGESREITLVLTKQMTAENTGLVSNTAEISEDYNIYGVSDKNSVPANKAQGEDDMSTADTILTVKTGESLIYVSGIIISLIIGSAVAFIVYERVLKSKRKGGV